ncbi:MAG: ribosome-binding factor A [bacterium]|nr:ribosome-binding factor A [bacterium]MDA1292992.1 ribosome-binding factor A [bacterium]
MLASVVRDVISPILHLCPKECKMVSITEVEVSEDFSYSTVYISALEEPEKALKFLGKKLPSLQSALGKIHRNRVPELRFCIDPRIDRGNRVDDLLKQENPDS